MYNSAIERKPNDPNSSGDTAVWSFTGLTPDRTYEVFVTWRADETLNSDSAFFDFDCGTPLCATVDQRESPESDSTAFSKQFEDGGPYYRRLQSFTATSAGTHTVTLSDISSPTGKRIVADAIRVVEAASTTTYEYDGAGNLWKTTDALGHATTFSFDEYLGRPKQILGNDPEGPAGPPMLGPIYDKVGNVLSDTDMLGNVTDYTYDARNRLKTATLPDPGTPDHGRPVYEYGYNYAGDLTSIEDPLHNVTTYTPDHLGRVTTVTGPDPDSPGTGELPAETAYEYDAAGNLYKVSVATDDDPSVTEYGYDYLGRCTSVKDPRSKTTSMTYDPLGNLKTLTDPLANTTTWSYDNLGRVIEEENASHDSRFYAYDDAGDLATYTDRNGRVIEYAYDHLHRNTSEQWRESANDPVTRTMTFAYDPLDRLETVADSQGSSNLYTYAFEYNAVGWLEKATTYLPGDDDSDVTLDYTYNDNGQVEALSATIGEGQSALPDFLNTYDYDDLGRMIFVEQEQQSQNNPVTLKYVTFHYDADSRMTQIKRYQRCQAQNDNVHLEDDLLVATSGYTYDNASRLTAVAHSGGGSWVSGGSWGPEWVVWPSDRFVSAVYSCGYDRAGRVISSSTPDGTATYSYDAAHQLEHATYSTGSPLPNESYDYDDNGNRESVIIGGTTDTYGTPGANNRLTFDGEYYYAYDDEGNRIERYQVSGGQHVQITLYGWDNRNRLVSVETKDTETGPVTKEVRYTYDAFDRRIVKSVDPDGAGTSAALHVVEQYVYDGRNIALVLSGNGVLKERYLYGPGVDQVLACEEANGLVSWMLADNQGTVRDVVRVDYYTQIEPSEVPVWIDGDWRNYHYAHGPYVCHADHISYDAYGNIVAQTLPANEPRFAYTGQEWDADAGMYYYDARYYDAHAGVFASEDPIGFLAGDPNLSRYCFNSPTNFVDPSGLIPWNPFSWPGEAIDCVGDIAQGVADDIDNKTVPTDQFAVRNSGMGGAAQLSRDEGADYRYAQTTRRSATSVPNGGHWEVDDPNESWINQHQRWVPDNPQVGMISGASNASGGGTTPVRGDQGSHWDVYEPATAKQVTEGVVATGINTAMVVIPAANLAAEGFAAAGSGLINGGRAAGAGLGTAGKASHGTTRVGGAYSDVRAANVGGEVHHMPANSVSPIPRADGPAIWMETADHGLTGSNGSGGWAAAYRADQQALINSGRFMDAVQMDIDNVHNLFGSKYDEAIEQMLDYIGR